MWCKCHSGQETYKEGKWFCKKCGLRVRQKKKELGVPHVRDYHKFTDEQNAMLSGEKAWQENIRNRQAFGESKRKGYYD
jgi:transcription elongation factor Elf1